MQETLEKDQIDRIFEYRSQSINAFYNRLNAFLIFESILLGVISIIESAEEPATNLASAYVTSFNDCI